MYFGFLEGEALLKEGSVALLALLDFLQLLDDFLGSAGTQLAAHPNITYLQPSIYTHNDKHNRSKNTNNRKKEIFSIST